LTRDLAPRLIGQYDREPQPLTSDTASELLKVLVVDDSRAMRGIVMRMLKQAGVDERGLLDAPTAEEALNVIRREKPMVGFADFNMPGMDGLELLRTVKSEGHALSFFMVTSEPEKVRSKAMALGAKEVIAKPVALQSLAEALAPFQQAGGIRAPRAVELSELLGNLLGRLVSAKPSHHALLASAGKLLVGVYEAESPGQLALLAMDHELTAFLAVAMSSGSREAALAAIRAGTLTPALMENARELLSVVAQRFNSPGKPPVSLKSVHIQLRTLPPRAVAMAIRPSYRLDLDVELSDFGRGSLCVCLA